MLTFGLQSAKIKIFEFGGPRYLKRGDRILDKGGSISRTELFRPGVSLWRRRQRAPRLLSRGVTLRDLLYQYVTTFRSFFFVCLAATMPLSDDQFDEADWSGNDEPLPALDSKKGFADRAKQEDIRQALRAACEIFVRVNNQSFSQMGSEAADDYCHYASLFIGKIWMDSVRKILDKEAGTFESKKIFKVFKLRVCNYLRKFFPGAQGQRISAPMHSFFRYFASADGSPMDGPVGRFLLDRLVAYIKTRHDRRLPPLHDRKVALRARVQEVVANGGGDFVSELL